MELNEKGQAQIITTVLIILLVLAAIVIVWQVVGGTLQAGTEQIEVQTACIGINMEVTNADVATNTVTVRRGQGSIDTVVTGYKVFVNGALAYDATGLSLGPLDTSTTPVLSTLIPPFALAGGATPSRVSVAAQVGNTVCGASSEVNAA